MRLPTLALSLALLPGCVPGLPRDGCVYPLRELVGRGRRGRAIYRTYGWSRGGAYKESLEAALDDRPDVLERLHRAEAEQNAGRWLFGSGVLGMLIGATVATLAASRFSHAHQPSQPATTIGLAGFGIGLGVAGIGGGLMIDGDLRFNRTLRRFNSEAEIQGCVAPPPEAPDNAPSP